MIFVPCGVCHYWLNRDYLWSLLPPQSGVCDQNKLSVSLLPGSVVFCNVNCWAVLLEEIPRGNQVFLCRKCICYRMYLKFQEKEVANHIKLLWVNSSHIAWQVMQFRTRQKDILGFSAQGQFLFHIWNLFRKKYLEHCICVTDIPCYLWLSAFNSCDNWRQLNLGLVQFFSAYWLKAQQTLAFVMLRSGLSLLNLQDITTTMTWLIHAALSHYACTYLDKSSLRFY